MLIKIVLFGFILVICCAEFEGDHCTQNGREGTCVNISKCPIASAVKETGLDVKICQNDGTTPIVCCLSNEYSPLWKLRPKRTIDPDKDCQPIPVPTAKKTGQKAFDKCIEYQEKYVYPCARSVALTSSYSRKNYCHHNAEQLIICGTETSEHEFPHMAIIQFEFDEKSAQILCGGSVISENFVLTAAHCSATSERVNVTHVTVGAWRRSDEKNKDNKYAVKRIITHPDYSSPSKYNDIALLETEKRMKLSHYIVPACLHVGNPVNDERVFATGWGQTKKKERDSFSDILLKVALEKFPMKDCEGIYTPHRHLANGLDYETQLCYGHRKEPKDTCQGDSGGPIQIKNKEIHCMYTIVGLTSWGKGCGFPGDPALYTRVSHYIPWIESIVWP